jgi:hypothetical protein
MPGFSCHSEELVLSEAEGSEATGESQCIDNHDLKNL